MDKKEVSLSPKQLKFLAYTLTGRTEEEAAEIAGVTQEDVAQWRRTKKFKEAEREHLTDIIEVSKQRAAQMLPLGYDKLEELLKATKMGAPDNRTRLQALDLLTKLTGLNKPVEDKTGGITLIMGSLDN